MERHWLRNIPNVDEAFISRFLEPIERLYDSHRELEVDIKAAELAASREAARRWRPSAVAAAAETAAAA